MAEGGAGEGDGDAETFIIERTPAPAALHPATLYRMGLIGLEAVPELLVFENQDQFDRDTMPPAGTALEGGTVEVHINDIIAEHGSRTGPVDSSWRRATIVVSRDELLSEAEMDYWNFFAARHAATRGVTTFHGVPSYYEATGRRVRLHTDVTPTTSAKIVNSPSCRYRTCRSTRWSSRGVRLDAPVPGLFAVGDTVTVSGTVTSAEDEVCVAWIRNGGGTYSYHCRTSRSFSVAYTFTEAGHYALSIAFPDREGEDGFPGTHITGITVE